MAGARGRGEERHRGSSQGQGGLSPRRDACRLRRGERLGRRPEGRSRPLARGQAALVGDEHAAAALRSARNGQDDLCQGALQLVADPAARHLGLDLARTRLSRRRRPAHAHGFRRGEGEGSDHSLRRRDRRHRQANGFDPRLRRLLEFRRQPHARTGRRGGQDRRRHHRRGDQPTAGHRCGPAALRPARKADRDPAAERHGTDGDLQTPSRQGPRRRAGDRSRCTVVAQGCKDAAGQSRKRDAVAAEAGDAAEAEASGERGGSGQHRFPATGPEDRPRRRARRMPRTGGRRPSGRRARRVPIPTSCCGRLR